MTITRRELISAGLVGGTGLLLTAGDTQFTDRSIHNEYNCYHFFPNKATDCHI
jgi:hypothetical protein